MSKKLKKSLAVLLAAALTFTYVPVENVLAVKGEAGQQEELDHAEEQLQDEAKASEETDTEAEEAAEETVKEAAVKEEAETVSEDTPVSGQKLNYVYVESPYLKAPGTQNIVVSWGDGSEKITDTALIVTKEDGTTEEWKSGKNSGALHLFSRQYEDQKEAASYEVTAFRFKENGVEQSYELSELNEVPAQFGVNKEYEGFAEDAVMLTAEASEEDVEASVVVFDENGKKESKNNIEEALNEVAGGAERLKRGRDADIIVALDPGHDDRHAGAAANGLKEEVLTLKIANYCKEVLETYSGVKVYMTRKDAKCPYPSTGSSGQCIIKRADAAYEAGAKIFVSFHLNSTIPAAAEKAQGAEVIYPNSNWKPQIGANGKALAQQIFEELKKLGLTGRNIYDKSANEDKYQDGSAKDWFAVQHANKSNGIPGIIVEHAFISNSSDANKFLKTEAGLEKLGTADAEGIAKYLKLSKIGDRQPVEEGAYVLESALNVNKAASVLEGGFNSKRALVISDKKEAPSQRFELVSAGSGYYYMIAEHSRRAVDITGGSSESGTPLQQYDLNRTAAQQWSFIDAGDGYYYIKSKQGLCMEVSGSEAANGTALTVSSFRGDKAQKWKLVKKNQKPVKDGTYTISSVSDSKKVMDVYGASMINGGNVQLFNSNNRSEQRFEITHVKDGYYKIIAEHSGRAFDVAGGSTKEGANLQQYGWNQSEAQLWKFVDAGNGQFYITSKKNTVISRDSAKANIYMMKADGSSLQKWKLTESSYRPVADGNYTMTSAASEAAKMSCATAKSGNIQLETYYNAENQKFKVQYIGGGYYKILENSTGKSLHVENASPNAKANLQLGAWKNGSAAQLWKFVDAGNGSYYIKSKLGTAVELQSGKTTAGTNIRMYTMNGTAAQKWIPDAGKAAAKDKPFANGTYTIRAGNNRNFVLDVASGSLANKANVRLYKSNNSAAQRYELYYVKDGYYKILAEHSGRALDVSAGSKNPGANVQQYTSNGSDAQLWKFISIGNGKYYIQSKKGTVLDLAGSAASGTNVQMNTLSGASTQCWEVESDKVLPLKNGTYSFRSSSSANKVLEVEGASTKDSGNVRLNTFKDLTSQEFDITHVKDGYYKIVAKHSGKALTVAGTSSKKGANAVQKSWAQLDGQLWKFIQAGGGAYYIKSKLGTVLDVKSGKIQAGTNVQMYTQNGTKAQKWTPRLEKEYKAVDVKAGTYVIHTAMNKNRVLDIAGGSGANGANVRLYHGNDTAAQRFKVEKVSGGYYRIVSEKTGKVLDVRSGSMAAKANVQQYEWKKADAQLWKFVDAGKVNGEQQYYLQSKLGNMLDVAGAKTAVGTNVQTYTPNGSIAQKWVLDTAADRPKLYKIMGQTASGLTPEKMAKFYKERAKTVNAVYPYGKENVPETDAPTIEDFCRMYIEECEAEGVRAEVAFSQAMMETGFLKFGGDVKKEQYNFAGLGATGNGEPGLKFDDIRTGIRAQVQHLKAYASKEDLNQDLVDERFEYVTKGIAGYVQWLGMQENPKSDEKGKYGWAAAPCYGYNLTKSYIHPLLAVK